MTARCGQRWVRVQLCVVLGVLTPSIALADQFNLYGYGPRAAAMGGALTADANDYTAVFYNPALLVTRKEINFGFHFQWYRMLSDVQPKQTTPALDCTSCNPPDAVGYSVGLLFPLAGKVKNRVAVGLGIYLPSAVMLRVSAPDPTTPYWYRYNSNPERIVVHAGAGIHIVDWLNVGIGVQALADLVGDGADVQVDLFSKIVKKRQLNSYLGTRVSPVFGVNLSPWKRLRFGATFRMEMKLVYEIPAKVDLEGIGTLSFAVVGVAHYTPHTLAFGVAYDVTDQLTLSLDGEWMNWSAANAVGCRPGGPRFTGGTCSPYVSLTIDLSGPTLAALGLDSALDLASPQNDPGFSDTLSVRFGGEYRLSERFAARLGVSYRPTPVPKQNVEGTNLLDGTTVGIAGGVGINFPDPLEIFQHPIQMDFAVQGAFLLPREAVKPPTDVVPSYTYSARLFGGTLAIRYDF